MANTPDAQAGESPAIDSERRLERAVGEMLGICKAILLDAVVDEAEATFLRNWIAAHPEVTRTFAGAAIARRLKKIFADRRVDPDEQRDLAELLEMVIAGQTEILVGQEAARALPLERPAPPLDFDDRTFVFIGKFAFGTREACEQTVTALGGRCERDISEQTRVVVIGSFGSSDWVNSGEAESILKAVDYRNAGVPLVVVSEDHWAKHLP